MLHVFGIRHHGPGCARSLCCALEELQPDAIVLEAPGDLEPVFHLARDPEMQPPVAMLVYPRDDPKRAVIYPMATFSPEWQALRWAGQTGCPVRAMDLPMSHRLALDAAESESPSTERVSKPAPVWRTDPLAVLADAAGYQDHELWWEEQIERRHDATDVFTAILEAMRAVREEFPESNERDLLREACMRKTVRQTLKEGFQNIAVVCGAWHAPVLDEAAIRGKVPGCTVREDRQRLNGLPRLKTVATWIPWTSTRLATRSGYGAGVPSPGWYAHLWESRTDAPIRWVAQAARLLREKDLGASSASVLDAARLAETLAALRELRSPGLRELNESILSVLCCGETAPFELIRQQLEIGDHLGTVPAATPSVPLAEDVQQLQKSLRLKPVLRRKLIDLDLRNDHARRQSHLIRRLQVLGISWGELQPDAATTSTFHEIWKLEWQPEFVVALIEANVWGNTLESAATARIRQRAAESTRLGEITTLLDVAIHAGLTTALPELIQQIQSASAVSTETLQLMQGLLPLARLLRYGDVRGTDLSALQPVAEEIALRICIGLPATCTGVDEDLAAQIIDGLQQTHQALELLQETELRDEFRQRLQTLIRSDVHPLIQGWTTRQLLEQQLLDEGELERLAAQAFSIAHDPARVAAWIQGLLQGSGLLLIHQEMLWRVMDRWLQQLSESGFVEMLPVLRRGFSNFSFAERRQMGNKVKHFGTSSPKEAEANRASESSTVLDVARAQRVLPQLARILGVKHD